MMRKKPANSTRNREVALDVHSWRDSIPEMIKKRRLRPHKLLLAGIMLVLLVIISIFVLLLFRPPREMTFLIGYNDVSVNPFLDSDIGSLNDVDSLSRFLENSRKHNAADQTNIKNPEPFVVWTIDIFEQLFSGDMGATSSASSQDAPSEVISPGNEILGKVDKKSFATLAENLRSSSEPLVIYLTMNCNVDQKGPYLEGATFKSKGEVNRNQVSISKIYVRDLLALFKKLPISKPKVLMLEVTNPILNEEMNQFVNTFPGALADLNEEIRRIPNLTVLTACGPGEYSWSINLLSRSAFSFFFQEALKGAASDANQNSILSLDEVYLYLKKSVSSWAMTTRSVRQTPVLYPLGTEGLRRAAQINFFKKESGWYKQPDFVALANARSQLRKRHGIERKLETFWGEVQQLQTRKNSPLLYAPVRWKECIIKLAHLEALRDEGELGSDALEASIRKDLEFLKFVLEDIKNLTKKLSPSPLLYVETDELSPSEQKKIVTYQQAADEIYHRLANAASAQSSQGKGAAKGKGATKGADPKSGADKDGDGAAGDATKKDAPSKDGKEAAPPKAAPKADASAKADKEKGADEGITESEITVSNLRKQIWNEWLAKQDASSLDISIVQSFIYDIIIKKSQQVPLLSISPNVKIARVIASTKQPWPPTLELIAELNHRVLPFVAPKDEEKVNNAISKAIAVSELSSQADGITTYTYLPFSGRTQHWYPDLLNRADIARRQGTDLLFGGATYVDQASEHLQNAQKMYAKIQEMQNNLSSAYTFLYTSTARLTDYSKLLPRLHVMANNQNIAEVRKLWTKINELAWLLEGEGNFANIKPAKSSDKLSAKRYDALYPQIAALNAEISNTLNFFEKRVANLTQTAMSNHSTNQQKVDAWQILNVLSSSTEIDWEKRSMVQQMMQEIDQELLNSWAEVFYSQQSGSSASRRMKQTTEVKPDLKNIWYSNNRQLLEWQLSIATTMLEPWDIKPVTQPTTTEKADEAVNEVITGIRASISKADTSSATENTTTPSSQDTDGTKSALQAAKVTAASVGSPGTPKTSTPTAARKENQNVTGAETKGSVGKNIAIENLFRRVPVSTLSTYSGDYANSHIVSTVTDLFLQKIKRQYDNHWMSRNCTSVPYYLGACCYTRDLLLTEYAHTAFPKEYADLLSQERIPVLVTPNAASIAFADACQIPLSFRLPKAVATQQESTVAGAPLSSDASNPEVAIDGNNWFTEGIPIVWLNTNSGAIKTGSVPLYSKKEQPSATSSPDKQTDTSVLEFSTELPVRVTASTSTPVAGKTKIPNNETTSLYQCWVNTYFRGLFFQHPTTITYSRVPSLKYYQNINSGGAKIAISASSSVLQKYGIADGALTIVLDCSGSMLGANDASTSGTAGGKRTKFDDAVLALTEMLATLPDGVQLSIWVFGEAVGKKKSVDDPNDSIRCIAGPVIWNTSQNKMLNEVKSLLKKSVEPWNKSPITETILKAKADLMRVRGSRTMLLITDGIDNCYDEGKIAPDISKALNKTGIQLNIIAFQASQKEYRQLLSQFEMPPSLSPAPKYKNVQESTALIAEVQKSVAVRLPFWVKPYNVAEQTFIIPTTNQGAPVTNDDANLAWFPKELAGGWYNVIVGGREPIMVPMALKEGDRLQLVLEEGSTTLQLQQKDFLTGTGEKSPAFASRGGWNARLFLDSANNLPGNKRSFLAMQNIDALKNIPLSVRHPWRFWIEPVLSKKQDFQGTTVWGAVPNALTPLWSVQFQVRQQQNHSSAATSKNSVVKQPATAAGPASTNTKTSAGKTLQLVQPDTKKKEVLPSTVLQPKGHPLPVKSRASKSSEPKKATPLPAKDAANSLAGKNTAQPESVGVQVWWLDGQSDPILAKLTRGNDFKNASSLARKVVSPASQTSPSTKGGGSGTSPQEGIVLEDFVFGEYSVMDKSGKMVKKPCCAMVVAHPPGSLVVAKTRGIEYEGREVWIYKEAGKTVTLLWPVNESNVNDYLQEITFHSIDQVKKVAEKNNNYLYLHDSKQTLPDIRE